MSAQTLTFGAVFLAGLASFLSPCVLPVLPGYISYLAARAAGKQPGTATRAEVFLHGVLFVLGFSACFIAFGAAASALSALLFAGRAWITRIGGAVIFLLGLHLAGILRLPFLDTDRRIESQPAARLGFLSSFLSGAFFAIGWSACTGPILGAVLTLAASESSLASGVGYLAVYSAGMGIPFLITAAAVDRIGPWVRRLGRVSRAVAVAAGLLFAVMGLLLMLDQFSLLARILPVMETGLGGPL